MDENSNIKVYCVCYDTYLEDADNGWSAAVQDGSIRTA